VAALDANKDIYYEPVTIKRHHIVF